MNKKRNMSRPRLLFNSHSRLGVFDLSNLNEWYPETNIPGMESWSWGPMFDDGRRIIIASYEQGKAWEGKIGVHLWIYDLDEQSLLEEIAVKKRPAPFITCSHILPGETRLLTHPIIDGKQRIWTINLDGTEPKEITREEDGFIYCVKISPDGQKLAYHSTMLEGRDSYCIFVMDIDGGNRVEVASKQNHLYFAPIWSPNGEWLIYQDCYYPNDPGHDWADLFLASKDGSIKHTITSGQRQWFSTSYGDLKTRGGGSNIADWTPDGKRVTYTRAEPGSRTAWPYQIDRPDTDHFNRDYHPNDAVGGTAICLLDPFTREETEFIPCQPRVWNFRSAWSPDGSLFAFCRAKVGLPSSIWVVNANGNNQQLLTDGYKHQGADHPVRVA